MTSGPHTIIATPLAPMDIEPRLRLKPETPGTGYVDGAWWPRSRELAAELPELLAAVTGRLGDIDRMAYNLTAWRTSARRFVGHGQRIRLEGFRSQHPDLLTFVGKTGGKRLVLLAVPPDYPAAAARSVLRAASQQDNVDSSETLLALGGIAPVRPAEIIAVPELELQRWELEGGRVGALLPARGPLR